MPAGVVMIKGTLFVITYCCFLGGAVLHLPIFAQPQPQQLDALSSGKVVALANQITVQILEDNEPLGSGILMAEEQGHYTVITADHIFLGQDLKSHYQVRLWDGKIYDAVISPQSAGLLSKQAGDLRQINFRAGIGSYPVATLSPSASLKVGELIYAAGFPLNYANNNFGVNAKAEAGASQPAPVTVRPGQVTVVLSKPLEGGYQIGFMNPKAIFKGFSGGALLNASGQVVGMIGLHAEALLPVTYHFADGTIPTPALQDTITNTSWAIPVNSGFSSHSPQPGFIVKSTERRTLPLLAKR